MVNIQTFIDRMRYWCNEANLGYDQSERQNIWPGGECDCSSLVIRALQEAGQDTGGASYTGDLSDNLCCRGWMRVVPDGNPQPGDILLHDVNHVAVWLGDCLAQASCDENGNIAGGESGDQSGQETNTRSYYDYPWNCYLRYTGGEPGPAPQPGTGGMYICVADCVRIRTAPSLSAEIVGKYNNGETVILDNDFTEADGCLWGTYISYSGNRRYIAISQNGETYFEHC